MAMVFRKCRAVAIAFAVTGYCAVAASSGLTAYCAVAACSGLTAYCAVAACSGLTGCSAGGRHAAPSTAPSRAPSIARPTPGTALASTRASAIVGPAIKVDTVGYPPDWRKIAVFNVEPTDPLVRALDGRVVLRVEAGDIHAFGVDGASGDPVWHVDFTRFTTPGRYRIESGTTRSDPFTIGPDLVRSVLTAAQKHYYYQRCRTALEPAYAGPYVRAHRCHVHDDVGWDLRDYPNKLHKRPLVEGWHDAGNYEIYVPSAAPTVQALLMAFERSPASFRDGDLDIPESHDGVPDLLDEVRWGLDWIFSMQDPDGGVHSREAVMTWSSGPPDEERTPRWVAGVGTASTAKATAAFALCARIYPPFDAAYAERCAHASRAGWQFLKLHPERMLVDGKGSDQPLWDDGREYPKEVGERLVAAVETWRTFRDPDALGRAEKLLADSDTQPSSFMRGAWANLSRWGLMELASDASTPAPLRDEARRRIVAAATSLRARIERDDGYRCASRSDGYYWGHNSNLLEAAHVILVAGRLSPDEAWTREAARDQWHWILGRNPIGYSMVTQVGKGPDRMVHTEWGKRSPPPPGYLVGGPDAKDMPFLAPGAPAKAIVWDNPRPLRSGLPAHSLWHEAESDLWDGGFVPENHWDVGWWTVAEPDIYYNSNLVLVAAELMP